MSILSHRPRVAFQGERGAFSEEAVIKLLGADVELVPRPTFAALFRSLDEGLADYALAPVENSLAGSIQPSLDLLREGSLRIAGEVIIPITHHLIGCPGTSFAEIEAVESHPVALAQCEQFFARYPKLRRIVSEDTAGSVARIIERGERKRAAIAGRRAAELYGGSVLKERLEDHRENYTRFLLLSNSAQLQESADKISLVIKLSHRPGALYEALAPFAMRGINLLKLESRPVRGNPWEYFFYLDLQGSTDDENVVAALAELEDCADEVRLLGCYPSARIYDTTKI